MTPIYHFFADHSEILHANACSERDALRAQRDELLAALESAHSALISIERMQTGASTKFDQLTALCQALARTEGKKARDAIARCKT